MKDLKELYAEKREIVQELVKKKIGSSEYGHWVAKLQEKNKEILEHPDFGSLWASEVSKVRMTPAFPRNHD